jgi:osmotically inducible protein OsmC
VSSLPVSWTSRVEDPEGNTSPEELLAAAQAVCYAMSLSNVLARGGHTPTNLDVTATCTFDRVDGKAAITEMDLSVRGSVEGLDTLQFQAAADEAEQSCPVANAIRGNVEITLEAELVAPAG